MQRLGRFVVRHPASLILGVSFLCAVFLWVRGGRHYDSVEFFTPKSVVIVHSEMRVLVAVATLHDDSSWEMFYTSDISTVDAPWFSAITPRFWITDGELELYIEVSQLVGALLLLTVGAFWVEKFLLRRRAARRTGA